MFYINLRGLLSLFLSWNGEKRKRRIEITMNFVYTSSLEIVEWKYFILDIVEWKYYVPGWK